MKPSSTAAAIAARQAQTQAKLAQVETTIAQLRRERGRLTVKAIARRADVSTTFLYENTDARALVRNAIDDSRSRHDRDNQNEHDRIEATWRERALNAEAELERTQAEVLAQRRRIGELMGQMTRKPSRTGRMAATRKGALPSGTFTLSNHPERLVIPQPYLEKMVSDAGLLARARGVELSHRHFLTINTNSMAVTAFTLPPGDVELPEEVTIFEWEEESPGPA